MQTFEDLSSTGRLNRAVIDSACPAIPEEIRAFAALVGSHINGKVDPMTCVLHIATCRHDITVGTSSFIGDNGKLPKEILDNTDAILKRADHVLYVIDSVTKSEFSDEVRRIASEYLGWHNAHKTLPIPPRGITDAVTWWADLTKHEVQGAVLKKALRKQFEQLAIHPQNYIILSPKDEDGTLKEAIDEANSKLAELGYPPLNLPEYAKMVIQANRIQAAPDGCPHHYEVIWTAIAR